MPFPRALTSGAACAPPPCPSFHWHVRETPTPALLQVPTSHPNQAPVALKIGMEEEENRCSASSWMCPEPCSLCSEGAAEHPPLVLWQHRGFPPHTPSPSPNHLTQKALANWQAGVHILCKHSSPLFLVPMTTFMSAASPTALGTDLCARGTSHPLTVPALSP